MKATALLLSLLLALAPAASAQSVEAASAAAESKGVPTDLVKKAASVVEKVKDKLEDGAAAKKAPATEQAPDANKASAAIKAATQGRSNASARKAKETDGPAAWGKDEVHKLAVMDVEYAGSTETIMFELFDKEAPRTVANFADNAESGTYNGLAIHRAIDSYLIQTGDPLTSDDSRRNEWGTGGEEKTVPAEIKRPHRVGSVAMARRNDKVNPSRSSNGYQFYITLGNMSALDGQYTVFGQVVSGIETLQALSRSPVDSNDCPLARIEVKSLKVVDQKGPLLVLRETGSKKRFTKPSSAKSAFERMLSRIW